ncbi:MrcB family domain-containing protein [Noviherbaspirillum sp.]|uniref:MrcB family domain-containing protein n=1 Tax=Noviherbaspirillum sp. TaxID=1926288 RepID=UPI002FE0A2AB
MQSVTELLSSLERQHFLRAVERIDAGAKTRFSDSTKFDMVFNGKRYAPKEVTGLALEEAFKHTFGPADFKGGDSSSAFRTLRRCGFTIVPKTAMEAPTSLKSIVSEILSLQTQYSSENTDEMKQRGFLVRVALRDLMYSHIEQFEPTFSASGYECTIEGRDGIGRKVMSAWTRIYDPEMSSSATQGWYVVIHFSSKGDYFYSTLGCGATVYKDGDLADVDPTELATRIHWAQQCFAGQPQLAARFSDAINLHGNHLSGQFEKATAFAKRYDPDCFDETEFWDDLVVLTRMLISIYESERLGKIPLSDAPEVREHQSQLSETIHPKSGSSRGQGRFLSQAEKTAVELHAMATIRAALAERGFTDIEDMSAKESYDFAAKKDGIDWFVEVKGTTSAYANSFLLTANELALHQENKGRTVLAIVYDIDINRDGGDPTATGGRLSIDIPWDPDQWEFKATAYSASRKNLAQTALGKTTN